MHWLDSLEWGSFRVYCAFTSWHGRFISICTGSRMHSLCRFKWYISQVLINTFLWLSNVLCCCRKLLRSLLTVWGWRQFVSWRLNDLELCKGSWLAYWRTHTFPVITVLICDAIFDLVKSGCVRYYLLAFFAPTITRPPTILVSYISYACTLRARAFVNPKHRAACILVCWTFICCAFDSWSMIFGRWLANAKVWTCWLPSSIANRCDSSCGGDVLGR